MTNLNGTGSRWQNALTRQRVLVGTPLLVGALIGAVVFAIAGLPHWLESGERTRRIAELKVQQQSLPLIAARMKQEQQKLVAAQQQQDLVVNLVAGRGEIETFLTQLSRMATETGVVIERYEPAAAAPGRRGSYGSAALAYAAPRPAADRGLPRRCPASVSSGSPMPGPTLPCVTSTILKGLMIPMAIYRVM